MFRFTIIVILVIQLFIYGCSESSDRIIKDDNLYEGIKRTLDGDVLSPILDKFGFDTHEHGEPERDLTSRQNLASNGKEDNITIEDLEMLEKVWLWSANIRSLDGLEHCKNLTYLSLEGNRISDLSPLSNLPNLENLNIRNNDISDLSPLSTLPELEDLTVGNRSRGLAFRGGGNNIIDYSPLSQCVALRKLDISDTGISDISTLSNLTQIETLSLWGNNISDISPLSNLKNLRILRLSINSISDAEPLRSLVNLRTLFMTDNQITDIGFIENLPQLENIVLDDNKIMDISPLARLSSPRWLSLANNNIEDISTLKWLKFIELEPKAIDRRRLDLTGNNITDISSLLTVENLDKVVLTDNPLSQKSIREVIPQLRRQGVEVITVGR